MGRIGVLGWLAIVLVATFCISSSAAYLVTIPYPYLNPNGGAVAVTVESALSGQAACSINIPLTYTGSFYYTTDEIFLLFLQASPYDNYVQSGAAILASWNENTVLNFGNQGIDFISWDETEIPYGSANFLHIPAQTNVPASQVIAGDYAALYLTLSVAGTYNVSAAVVQEVSPYNYNQNTTVVYPYTANVVVYPYYYSSLTTYYEICSGNLSNWEETWGTNSVYRFWLPQYGQTSQQTFGSNVGNPVLQSTYNNFQINVVSNPANYTIGFDRFYSWRWPPLIGSYDFYGPSYAILFNLPPQSLPASEAQVTTFRFSYWPGVGASNNVPMGSSLVAAISWDNTLILQPTFSSYSCGSFYASDVTITLLSSNTPVLAAQPCFVSNNMYQVDSLEEPNYFAQIGGFEVTNNYDNAIISISGFYSSSAASQCYGCMVSVTINTSSCGVITFPPVSVSELNVGSSPMIGKWQVLVPTILAVIFAILVILLVARLAGYRARFERAGGYQSVTASPTETTPLTAPSTGFPTSHMPVPSAPPAPSTIPYNPNPAPYNPYQPQNQGSSHNYYALYGLPQPQPLQQPAQQPAQH